MLPIAIKQSPLNSTHKTLKIQVLVWDRQRNEAVLNRLMRSPNLLLMYNYALMRSPNLLLMYNYALMRSPYLLLMYKYALMRSPNLLLMYKYA
jgi:hypothetical protein